MQFNYDQQTDSLYIHFMDRPGVDTFEVTDRVVADVDAEGTLVGLDIQHASQVTNLSQFLVDGINPAIIQQQTS